MSADYRVDITLGPYSWSINRGDAPNLPEIADGLSIGWQYPDTNLWPIQPEPVTASFSVIAEAAADVAGVDRGSPVLIRVWAGVVVDGVDRDSITFTGKVGELVGAPIKFGHPATGLEVDGWRLDVQAVDLYVDLHETPVSGYENPPGLSGFRWSDMFFDLAGLALPEVPAGVDTGGGTSHLTTDPGGGTAIEATTVASAAEGYLSLTAYGGDTEFGIISVNPFDYEDYAVHGWRRPIIRPNVDAAGVVDPANPYRYELVSRRYGEDPAAGPAAPAVLADLGGGLYGPSLAPPAAGVDDGSLVIDAGYLTYDATWTRSKLDDPNQVVVSTSLPPERFTDLADQASPPWLSVTSENRAADEEPVTTVISDTRIQSVYQAGFLANMYLDDSANEEIVWAPSGFRWLASEDPAWPVNRSLFPGTALAGDYSAPVVITGIPASQRPTPHEWVVGVVRGATWTFERGAFSIGFELYPRIPAPIAAPNVGLTWAELDTAHPALDWDDLDPAYRWLDYRLLRSDTYN